jgi:NADPH:quinone reductase
MRAVAVREFGAIPELLEVPEPEAGRGEVKVRLHAAGVNPFDWKVADGILKNRPHVFPLVLGVDGAGVVTELGAGATRFRVGDSICGQFLHDPVGIGTYAEYATVPEGIGVAKIPPRLGFSPAAALPTSGMTALEAIEFLAPARGSTTLVVGASGGVGSFAVQLAFGRGAQVIGTARGNGADRVRALGAAEVVDPEHGDPVAQVRALHPGGVDALLDLGSDRATFARFAELVRDGGAATTTVYVADEQALGRRGIRAHNIDLQPRSELLTRLLAEAAQGRLQIPVETEVQLSEAPQAIAASRARTSVGKTVVRIRPDP